MFYKHLPQEQIVFNNFESFLLVENWAEKDEYIRRILQVQGG